MKVELILESQEEADAFRSIMASRSIRHAAEEVFNTDLTGLKSIFREIQLQGIAEYNHTTHETFLVKLRTQITAYFGV